MLEGFRLAVASARDRCGFSAQGFRSTSSRFKALAACLESRRLGIGTSRIAHISQNKVIPNGNRLGAEKVLVRATAVLVVDMSWQQQWQWQRHRNRRFDCDGSFSHRRSSSGSGSGHGSGGEQR